MHQTDEQLIVICQSAPNSPEGNEAFGELVRRYSKLMEKSIGARLRGDYHTAADIVQTVFLKIFCIIDKFDADRGLFSKWLFFVADNTFRDIMRAEGRHVSLVTNFADVVNGRNKRIYLNEIVDRQQDSPLQIAQQNEMRDRFWACVDTMPRKKREAICLIYVEGLSYTEAAKVSGEPKTTLKKRVSSGRENLREILGTIFGDDCSDLTLYLERRTEPRLAQENLPRTQAA